MREKAFGKRKNHLAPKAPNAPVNASVPQASRRCIGSTSKIDDSLNQRSIIKTAETIDTLYRPGIV